MKLFEVNEKQTKYWVPIAKLFCALAIICLSFFRDSFLPESIIWVRILSSIVAVVLSSVSILIIYLSVGELFHVVSNRKELQVNTANVTGFTIDDIRKLVTRDSIIEILILTTDGVVKIGASADNLFNSSTFFDKRYYIDEMEFIECEDFIRELRRFTIDGIVNVLSIDGIPVNKVKKTKRKRSS